MTYIMPTLPTLPTLISDTRPDSIVVNEVNLPSRISAVANTMSSNKTNERLIAFSYIRYGTVIQDLIDSQITELLSDDGDAEIDTKIGMIKENILSIAREQSVNILNEAGGKGYSMIPGSYKKKIYLLEKAARKELEIKIFELFQDSVKISQENLQFALEQGAGKESKLLSHHNKVQMANESAVIALANGLYQTYLKQVQWYNSEVEELSMLANNFTVKRQNQLDIWQNYLATLDSYIIEGQNEIINSEVIKAGIIAVDLENHINLTNIKLIENEISIKKSNLLVYNSEIEQYTANLEIINATYNQYMADVKTVQADKKDYLKDLEHIRFDIKNYNLDIDNQKQKANIDLMNARLSLETFKNSVNNFNSLVESRKTEYDVTRSDYDTTLTEFTTSLQDSFLATEIAYNKSLSDMEEANKAEFGDDKTVGNSRMKYNRSRLTDSYTKNRSGYASYTIARDAEYKSASNTTLNFAHELNDQTT